MEPSMTDEQRYRVGIDIGGTFTDIVISGSNGAFYTKKTPSTPTDYSHGIITGLFEVLRDNLWKAIFDMAAKRVANVDLLAMYGKLHGSTGLMLCQITRGRRNRAFQPARCGTIMTVFNRVNIPSRA